MPHKDEKRAWEQYRERELERGTHVLSKLGFTLDAAQSHIGGERYLMMGSRDVGGGGYKLVLTGKRAADGTRVIIKISSDKMGSREIETERTARETLRALKFAYHTFLSPEEILFTKQAGFTIFITAYIEQEKNFLERPLQEQFSLILRALKTQEGVHATTYAHGKTIRPTLGFMGSKDYVQTFISFKKTSILNDPNNAALQTSLNKAETFLHINSEIIEQYSGFLTHADFVPHNLRINNNDIYLLDYASIHFGNKYESWARFCNFMLLYNRPLEQALLQYVKDNRTPEEYLSLRLMRVYKLAFLLAFYTSNLSRTSGDLYELTKKRIAFWTNVLQSILDDTPVAEDFIRSYQSSRDSLRSEEEKKRQEELH